MVGVQNTGSKSNVASEANEAMAAQLTAPTALRKLVLNYLIHHCYIDTAQAFADDGISSSSNPANGIAGRNDIEAEDAALSTSSKQAALRKANGSSSSSHARTSSRLAAGQHSTSAHPLSAPPLSREDSSMEVEVDHLLMTAKTEGNGQASSNESSRRAEASLPSNGSKGTLTASRPGDSEEELSAGDLQHVRIRKEVRDSIVAGRVRQAIELCNRHFPSVLNATHEDALAKGSKNVSTDGSVSAHANGKEHGTTTTTAAAASGENERILPSNPTSLDPAHLSLNLQIQAFIEIVRAASSGTAASPTMTSSIPSINTHQGASAMPSMHSIVSSTPGIAAAAISRSASPAPSSTSSTGSATSANGMSGSAHSAGGSSAPVNPVLQTALRHAQSLYRDVQSLPAYWRAMYLKELESVTTMLAYTDLERSPVSKYLDQERRVALAEQINSAIIFRSGKPSQPLIESAVRQTTFCWSTLAQDKVAVPASHPLFSSGTVIGLDSFDTSDPTRSGGTTAGISADRAKNHKVLPPFDLHTFLRER